MCLAMLLFNFLLVTLLCRPAANSLYMLLISDCFLSLSSQGGNHRKGNAGTTNLVSGFR